MYRPGPALRLRIAILLSLLAWTAVPAVGGEPAPYDVAVVVRYGPFPGSERLREEIERETVLELSEARCFRSIVPRSSEDREAPDLLLRLTLGRPESRTSYEASLGERQAPNAMPETRQRVVARIEVAVDAELLLARDETALRAKSYGVTQLHRPTVPGEDAEYEARRKLVEQVARSATKLACRGSAKRLAREIREIDEAGSSD